MDKIFADKTIIKFQKIFFGFALSKTSDVREAEELASRIILEAYATLLKTEGVENWDGYLYRIAHHIYVRYLEEKKKNQSSSIDEIELPLDLDFTSEIEKSEEFQLLRREIAYLGFLQRSIIVMFYYQNLKINEIAKRLNLSAGTVKWHLYDARHQLKEGIKIMRTPGDLSIAPISFSDMGHSGRPGNQGDTNFYLNSKLRQNIVYAAYDQPRTVNEIAKELGITPVYVEDEVNYLEEYGFLDKLTGGKYRTNVFIFRSSAECEAKKVELLKSFADKVCDEYIPLLFKTFEQDNFTDIYYPDNDKNYLLWSLIPYVTGYKAGEEAYKDELKGTNYLVKRKDGGEYIAFAKLEQDIRTDKKEHYNVCGNMIRNSNLYQVASWQLSTAFDSREFGWQDNKAEDYEYLYQFITGKLPKEEALADKYQRLYDRGLIINRAGIDNVNVTVVKINNQNAYINPHNNEFINKLPNIPEHLLNEMKDTDTRIYEIQKSYYPEHMHRLLKARNRNCIGTNEVRIMVIDELLKRGILKTPAEEQKKGLMTIVFSDTNPIF